MSAVTMSTKPLLALRPPCDACRTRGRGLCHALPAAEVTRLMRPGSLKVPAGTEVLRLGEPAPDVLVVLDGWVLIHVLLGDGRRQVLRVALRGDVLALGVDGGCLPYTAQALTEVSFCVVTRRRLLDACRIHPAFGIDLLQLVSAECLQAYDHLTSVGRLTARERVAHLLLEIFNRAREAYPDTDARAIPLPLTQAHIGDALGLTAVHTNRMLASLRDDGILSVSRRMLHILDAERLAAAVGFGA